MALPGVSDLKALLRIEQPAEDALLARLLAAAVADVEAYVHVPLIAESRTFYDVRPYWDHARWRWMIMLPLAPVRPPAAATGDEAAVVLTVTDDAGVVVSAANYRLEPLAGLLVPVTTFTWGAGPYTVVATVGLSAHPSYGTRVEPALGGAVLDLAAEKWHNRNPSAQAEGAGGGVYTQRNATQGIPARIMAQLDPFRVPRV